MTPFSVTKHDAGAGVSRLAVTGEVDEDTADGLTVLMMNAAEQVAVSEIVVDLRQVTFLAAAGVRALMRGRDAAAALGHGFRVVNASGIVLRVLRISGVTQILSVTTESVIAGEHDRCSTAAQS